MWKFVPVVKRNLGYFLYAVATEEINCKREKEGKSVEMKICTCVPIMWDKTHVLI